MAATMKSAISPFRQPRAEPNANSIRFLDEVLAVVPASGIPEEFRTLSRFLPVIVLVPLSAIEDKTAQKKSGPKSVTGRINSSNVCLPLDAAKAWLRNPGATDMFEFGGVTGCFSTMEIHRNGRPVVLTCKEFKTLAYLIKNPRRVISRDELLNEVWGYENYPCTRTVDNHILRLRKKLETEPARPRHFHTVHSSGYKFLPESFHHLGAIASRELPVHELRRLPVACKMTWECPWHRWSMASKTWRCTGHSPCRRHHPYVGMVRSSRRLGRVLQSALAGLSGSVCRTSFGLGMAGRDSSRRPATNSGNIPATGYCSP
jgi:DNA-binding response OmpR family regulator